MDRPQGLRGRQAADVIIDDDDLSSHRLYRSSMRDGN